MKCSGYMTLRLRGCEDVLELRMSDGKPKITWIPIGLWKPEPGAKGIVEVSHDGQPLMYSRSNQSPC